MINLSFIDEIVLADIIAGIAQAVPLNNGIIAVAYKYLILRPPTNNILIIIKKIIKVELKSGCRKIKHKVIKK